MSEADARELQAILAQVAAAITAKQPKTPIDRLTTWQDGVERSIQEKLRLASYQTNQTLQRFSLIPPQVPERALEAAARVDQDSNSPVAHVVQMLVETQDRSQDRSSQSSEPSEGNSASDQSSNLKSSSLKTSSEASLKIRSTARDSKVRKSDRKSGRVGSDFMAASPKLIHVIALQMRLSELEFNDPILMRWRSRLRELADNTQALIQEYRKYQRKKLTAEAQVAWRSTWLSDRDTSLENRQDQATETITSDSPLNASSSALKPLMSMDSPEDKSDRSSETPRSDAAEDFPGDANS